MVTFKSKLFLNFSKSRVSNATGELLYTKENSLPTG